ncbi:CRISPR-associated endonuclease Cas3'' [Streptomyces sp. NBC_00154]|uniref:CRISPR-associated endonuclease Cas3'' n=1 Tax=Streptomyces sp. NBC_00154 TaxID=2975670 RepID=UPI00224F6165|nr:CRISPR-associated endonuclease Cas3'' [Streptomyces sp. NBC_00154]MCX5317821.1 CRISPR-associated endonuclease Cas3'' [Streptomyces sp. NBC_00154]
MSRSGLRGRLDGPVLTVWAKHDRDSDGWLPLWRHMEDSAAVAGLLWDTWLPASVRKLIASALPGGEQDARRLAVWLAGVHDIGKATPAFACQVDQLADLMREQGLEMRSARAIGPDRRVAPHGLAGQALLGEWLKERHGWTVKQTGQVTVVVGGHPWVPDGPCDPSGRSDRQKKERPFDVVDPADIDLAHPLTVVLKDAWDQQCR